MEANRIPLQANTRNSVIDSIKTFAALAVVFIHYNNVQGTFGEYYTSICNSLCRFAVPYFFMVSGYFIPSLIEKGKISRYLIKIIKYGVYSTMFYTLFYLLLAFMNGTTQNFIQGWNKVSAFMFIAHNDVPYGPHLWYFYALIYAVLIYIYIYI